MPASHLSARSRQPGHDRTFLTSERAVERAFRLLLPAWFDVDAQPRDLADLFGPNPDTGRPLGVVPELRIVNRRSGRLLYVEVKKQGPTGNAEERAARHYTVPFIAAIGARTRLDYHPWATVFCGNLASDGRYLAKLPFLVPDGHRLAWDGVDLCAFARFVAGWRHRHLG